MAKLPKALTDSLERHGWKTLEDRWVKEGYMIAIKKLQNHNFAIEIRKMSVVNVKIMSIDELERFIENPSITYKQ